MTEAFLFWDGAGRASWDGGNLDIVGDRVVPSEIVVQVRGGMNQPDLEMKIQVRGGVPECVEVCLRARPGGPEVREKDLAAIRLGDWLDQIIAHSSMKLAYNPDGTPGGWGKPIDDDGARSDIRHARTGRVRVTDERLQKVAGVYRQHYRTRPTAAVARAFGVSHRTAARYVQQARKAGHLPETSPGRKKV